MSILTLQSLPLFSLGAVLFPGGVLPLRVFEVRYLDMVGRCHRAGAPFGIVALTQGREVRTPEAPEERLAPIGTLAHIRALDRPQPGLMLIECHGSQRFRIDRPERLRHGLWVADVSLLPADPQVSLPPELQYVARALRRVLQHPQSQQPSPVGLPQPGEEPFTDCGWVANRWCELLPLPLSLKQQLMSLDGPLLRLELVADLLERTGIDRPPD